MDLIDKIRSLGLNVVHGQPIPFVSPSTPPTSKTPIKPFSSAAAGKRPIGEAGSSRYDPIALFEDALKTWGLDQGSQEKDTHPSYRVIPRFHFGGFFSQREEPENSMKSKFKAITREFQFARKSDEETVTNAELEVLWNTLEQLSDDRDDEGNAWIKYESLLACRDKMSTASNKFHKFFRPCLVLCLSRNSKGKISINQFFDLVMRQVNIRQTRIMLCAYDESGYGYISETDLQSYIFDKIADMPQLREMHEDFFVTYAVYASCKFLFFLDPQKKGRIKIKTLLQSDILAEFFELQAEELLPRYAESNWFALPFVTRIHSEYLQLDYDGNGLLSKSEFREVNNYSLSEIYVDRLFQENITYGGEIDYKTFVEFVLTRENPRHERSIQFHFRLLNIDKNGKLSPSVIGYFWRGIAELHPWTADMDPIREEDIIAEIFDMISPADPKFITLDDLIRSGNGHTVCSILTDVKAFFEYEQREVPQAEAP